MVMNHNDAPTHMPGEGPWDERTTCEDCGEDYAKCVCVMDLPEDLDE